MQGVLHLLRSEAPKEVPKHVMQCLLCGRLRHPKPLQRNTSARPTRKMQMHPCSIHDSLHSATILRSCHQLVGTHLPRFFRPAALPYWPMPDPVSDISLDPINGTVLKSDSERALSKSRWSTRCGPFLIGRQARDARLRCCPERIGCIIYGPG